MKALVIGIDSASPYLIQKWLGKLPNLQSIFENGVHGILQSIVPPESVPAWQCFATGKNPAKIGVYGFRYIGRDRRLRAGRATPDLGCFWDYCSAAGQRVGVFNVPGTYPPYPVNGFMVSGFPVPTRSVWAYPKEIMRDIDREVGGYEIDVPVTNPTQMRGGERAYLAQVERLHLKCLEATKMLISRHQPDIFMMTFQGVDLVHHDFWRYMNDQNSPFRNVVQDWYVRMDGAIGELRRFADSSTYTLVLSDHGSAPVSTSFFINKYLTANGLLIAKNHAKHKGETYTRIRSWVLRTLPPETIARIYKSTPNFISHKLTLSGTIERILLNLVNNIDWERTRAFSTGGHQAHIYVNTDSSGVESDGEAKRCQVVRDIIRLMSELSHPLTREKIRPVFHFREDCFQGPYEKEAPDVCVELYSGEEKVQINPRLGSGELWNSAPHFSSVHTREGFWGMCGPGISQGCSLDVKLVDLAPTLLSLLGLRIDTDFDGRALSEILASENSLVRNVESTI